MRLKNSNKKFGTIAKLLHWTIVFIFIYQYVSVSLVKYILRKDSPLRPLLIGSIHKPLGFFLFFIGITALFWHIMNVKVKFSDSMPSWEKWFALFVHRSLYVSLICMAFSGIAMSLIGGKSINLFNLLTVPAFEEKNKALSGLFWSFHKFFAIVLMVLVGLHLGGIMKQHFLRKDPVLKKMLPDFNFKKKKSR